MIPLLVLGLAGAVVLGVVLGLCRAASKPSPMPTDQEVKLMENHLMRRALMRGSGK